MQRTAKAIPEILDYCDGTGYQSAFNLAKDLAAGAGIVAALTHRITWGVVSPCVYHPGVYFDEAIGLLHNTVTGLITASDWLQWIMERHAQQDAVRVMQDTSLHCCVQR